jgi:hypothetical protein
MEPTTLWLYDFGGGTYTQNRCGWAIPVSTSDVSSELRYDTGLYHTCLSTKDWRCLRFLTPAFEANGTTALNESGSGNTVLNLTTGIRWLVREVDEVGFGWSFPVTGSRQFQDQFIFSYRLHF